jgi:hypothetical protein
MGKLYSIYKDHMHPFTASSPMYIELNVSGAAAGKVIKPIMVDSIITARTTVIKLLSS